MRLFGTKLLGCDQRLTVRGRVAHVLSVEGADGHGEGVGFDVGDVGGSELGHLSIRAAALSNCAY